MKNLERQSGYSMGIYLRITSIITLITMAIIVAGTVIGYPTEAHRTTSAKLSAFNEQAIKNGFNPEIFESQDYRDTMNSPEARYSMGVGVIMTVAMLVSSILFAGITYNYLRKNFVSKTRRALGATVVVNVVASTLSYLVTLPAVAKLSSQPLPNVGVIVSSTLLSIVVGAILTFIVVRIFEQLYDRKHSFIVE